MASSDWLKARNGSAALPAFSAATPKAIDTTSNCRTLKFSEVLAAPLLILVDASRPKTLAGTRPLRKSSQEPVEDGAAAAVLAIAVLTPGWMTRPSTMPMTTAIKAVMANQSSVCQTSFAALERFLRLAMEATMAVKISGGTSARSSWTNMLPMVCSVTESQLGLPAASGPILRATRPSSRPMTMAIRT